MLRFFAAFLALTFVSACGGTQLLNSVAVNPGKIERDIAYGALPRQKLDVYSPKEMKADTPTLVFFHGGSWQYGSKDDYRFLGTAFAARGKGFGLYQSKHIKGPPDLYCGPLSRRPYRHHGVP
jgi:hypothetical protein